MATKNKSTAKKLKKSFEIGLTIFLGASLYFGGKTIYNQKEKLASFVPQRASLFLAEKVLPNIPKKILEDLLEEDNPYFAIQEEKIDGKEAKIDIKYLRKKYTINIDPKKKTYTIDPDTPENIALSIVRDYEEYKSKNLTERYKKIKNRVTNFGFVSSYVSSEQKENRVDQSFSEQEKNEINQNKTYEEQQTTSIEQRNESEQNQSNESSKEKIEINKKLQRYLNINFDLIYKQEKPNSEIEIPFTFENEQRIKVLEDILDEKISWEEGIKKLEEIDPLPNQKDNNSKNSSKKTIKPSGKLSNYTYNSKEFFGLSLFECPNYSFLYPSELKLFYIDKETPSFVLEEGTYITSHPKGFIQTNTKHILFFPYSDPMTYFEFVPAYKNIGLYPSIITFCTNEQSSMNSLFNIFANPPNPEEFFNNHKREAEEYIEESKTLRSFGKDIREVKVQNLPYTTRELKGEYFEFRINNKRSDENSLVAIWYLKGGKLKGEYIFKHISDLEKEGYPNRFGEIFKEVIIKSFKPK